MSLSPPRRPSASETDVLDLARELYGLEGEVRELDGDTDRNFRLRTADGRSYALKISPGSRGRTVLELQGRALAHLASVRKAGADLGRLEVPSMVPTRTGDELGSWVDRDGRDAWVRLVTWIHGHPMAKVRPHTADLYRQIGEGLGRLDRALLDFDGPGTERPFAWDLARGAEVVAERSAALATDSSTTSATLFPSLEDRQRLVRAVLTDHAEHVAPHAAALRRGVLHGDANDYNLVLRVERGRQPRLAGLIDFGDMGRSHLVNEVAIAGAYAVMDAPHPVRTLGHLAAGYDSVLALEERELAVLFHLVRLRLATSACMAAHQRAQEPENEYLSVSEAPAWRALARLDGIHPRLVERSLRVACGLPAHPSGPRLAGWLEQRRGTFGKLVDGKIDTAEVLDLSIASPTLAAMERPTDPVALDRQLRRRLERAGADFAFGRWDEPRALYAGAQFDTSSSADAGPAGDPFAGDPTAERSPAGAEPAERRTVHVGIDLFQPAGSPVYAPLDGVVHSLADNDLPFDYGPTLVLRHRLLAEPPPDEEGADEGEREGHDELELYSLYGHLSRDSLAGKFEGMVIEEGDLLGHMGEIEVNGGWAPHLHFQLMVDMFDHYGEYPGVAAPSERELWRQLCPDPGAIVDVPADRFPAPELDAAAILERRRARIGPNLSLSYRQPLHIVAGRGQYLFDAEGRSYLDAVNNVPHVGHCHPRVVRAACEQKAVLETNTRYLHADLVRYADRLIATLPDPLAVVFFCCTGSEANDLALRLARIHTGQRDVVCVEGAYHGHTAALIGISPYKYDGPGGPGAPASTHPVPLPCAYRGEHRGADAAGRDLGRLYAESVREACARAGENGVAAFVCESVLGCGGQVVLPEGYLEAAYGHARAAGAITIADEVQVGFGRVGSHFWAFETQGVVPDIVTIGKPIGNGHPMAAVITTDAVARSFANGMEYFNTFGGNPASCRVGLAVLDVLEQEGLQAHALRVGERLLAGLRELQERHALVGQVRGLGLFVGIELVRDRQTLEPADVEASYVANRMRDHRILISTDGPWHNVLKIKPPMVFDEADADRLVHTLDAILAEDPVQPS